MPALLNHLQTKHEYSEDRLHKIQRVRNFLRSTLTDDKVQINWKMPENAEALDEPMLVSGDTLFLNWKDSVALNIGVIIANFPFFDQRVKRNGKLPRDELRLKPFVPPGPQPVDEAVPEDMPELAPVGPVPAAAPLPAPAPAPKKPGKKQGKKLVPRKNKPNDAGEVPSKRPVTRAQRKAAEEQRKKQKQGMQ